MIEERFRSLSELKIHPREDLANRTLMARLERLYEESLGGLRDFLAAEAAAFAAALERQDPKLIAAARDRAHEAVRSAESDAGLR